MQSLDQLYPTLKATLAGDYRIEHRMMLEVVVDWATRSRPDRTARRDCRFLTKSEPVMKWRADYTDRNLKAEAHFTEPQRKFKKPFRAFALNDVVIRHYTRLIELDAHIDGETLYTLQC